MKNKKIVYLLVVVVALASIVLFSQKTEREEEVIKIGVISPLTGDLAFWGESTLLGIELAKIDLEKEGINIKFIIEDGKLDSNLALTASQKLVNIDKAMAIYSEFTPASISVSSFLKDKNVFHLYSSAVSSPLEESENNYKTYVDFKENCREVSRHLKSQGIERIGFLQQNLQFAFLCKEGLEEIYSENLFVETYNPGEVDFKTSLLKLNNNNVGAIFNVGFGPEITNTLKQMTELGIENKKFITNSDAVGPDLLNKESHLLVNTITFGLPDVSEEFIQRVKSELSIELIPVPEATALAYLHLMQMARALNKCDSNIACIKQEMDIASNQNFVSFNGFVNRVANFDVPMKEWTGDEFVLIK